MPNSYDCSRNVLTDRAAARRTEQVDYRLARRRRAAFERRLAALENRVDELETWQKHKHRNSELYDV